MKARSVFLKLKRFFMLERNEGIVKAECYSRLVYSFPVYSHDVLSLSTYGGCTKNSPVV